MIPRSFRSAGALAFAAFIAACSDGGVGPVPEVTLAIYRDAARIREASVAVGDSIELSVRFGDGSATEPTEDPAEPLSWWSENPSVAEVTAGDGLGATVRGIALGSTRVIASSGAAADTVIVLVLSGQAAECGEGGVALVPGESFTMNGAAAATLCFPAAPAGGAEYLIVPFNASLASGVLRAEVVGEGIVAAGVDDEAGSAAALAGPEAGVGELVEGAFERLPDGAGGRNDIGADFDRRLREQERRELSPLVGPRSAEGASAAPGAAGAGYAEIAAAVTTPFIGEVMQLNVNSQQTCTSPTMRSARVTAVGDQIVLLEDLSNPSGGFTPAEYQSLADSYDEYVHTVLTNNFGAGTDIDGNGRVLALVTRAVNELTPSGSNSYVAGFFFARDLFPKTDTNGLRACGASNVAELLYLLAPDPNGAVNGNRRGKQEVFDRTVGIIAHEAQHMVNASRRLYIRRNQNWNEAFWLNEGLSHIAEELTFYTMTTLRPREELTLTRVRAANQGITRLNQFQASNFGRFSDYLRDPASSSSIAGDGLATRGAAWAFLRYAADRRGGDEKTLWRALVDADLTGYDNLLAALGTSPFSWLHDWTLANYADDFVPGVPVRFRQPSWDFRSILPALSMNGNSYPLKVIDLVPGSGGRVDLELVAAGSAIVRFRAPAGGETRVLVTSGGMPAPDHLRVTVMRVR